MNLSLLHQLQTAYYKARQNKRKTLNQLRFEINFESELLALHDELLNQSYCLSQGIMFINESPVRREIIAADFRDRVIHHLLFDWIYPIFDRQFIHDSYSCRINKGTLFGINRVRGFMRAASKDYCIPCYALRLDVLGYFMSIHRPTLFELVFQGLDKADYWSQIEPWQAKLTRFLLKQIIFHDAVAGSELKGSPEDWRALPLSKSLIAAPRDCGLPIGNLTSQLFGNIYLNPLDHFIKRKLKVKYYGRYVDDMVLLDSDPSRLRESITEIQVFLKEKLSLNLHPKKIHLQALDKGFPFLGAYLLPHRIYVGKRIKHNAKRAFLNYDIDGCFNDSQQSYLGLLKHFDSYRLKESFLKS